MDVKPGETVTSLHSRRALSIRERTNTEIVLKSKQQLSFWLNLNSYLLKNPEHPLKRLIEYGERINVNYLRFYTNLETMYQTPQNCRLNEEYKTKIRTQALIDTDSRSVVYLQVTDVFPINQV